MTRQSPDDRRARILAAGAPSDPSRVTPRTLLAMLDAGLDLPTEAAWQARGDVEVSPAVAALSDDYAAACRALEAAEEAILDAAEAEL